MSTKKIQEDVTPNGANMSLTRNVNNYTTCLGKKKDCRNGKCKCIPERRKFPKQHSMKEDEALSEELMEAQKAAKKKKEKDEKQKKWIQGAIKKEGSFTAYCKKKGFNGVTDECVRMGMQSKDKTVQRRARLAKTLRKMA